MPTNPSLWWADSGEGLRRALERAARPPASKAAAPAPAGAGPLARPAPVAATAEPGTRERPAFVPAFGSLEDRLHSWLDWILETLSGVDVFLLDKDGLPMLPRGADSRLLDLASFARGFFGRLGEGGAGLGSMDLAMRLDPERVLHLYELSTPLGVVTLGFVRRASATAGTAGLLAASVQRCFASAPETAR